MHEVCFQVIRIKYVCVYMYMFMLVVGFWVWGFVGWGVGAEMCVLVVVCGGVGYVWVCGRGILNLVRLRRRPSLACVVLVVGHVVSMVFRPMRIVGFASIWSHRLCVLWKV